MSTWCSEAIGWSWRSGQERALVAGNLGLLAPRVGLGPFFGFDDYGFEHEPLQKQFPRRFSTRMADVVHSIEHAPLHRLGH